MKGIERDAGSDPGVVSFRIWLKGYGPIVPADLDPSRFYVRDAAGTRYEALPASDPEDCTADMTTISEVEVTCWVSFVMPLSVGLAPDGGRSGAVVGFDSGGYRREVHFTFYPGGGSATGI